jgi:hypothetical protein
MSYLPVEPRDTNEFIEVIRTAGKRYEEYRRTSKASDKKDAHKASDQKTAPARTDTNPSSSKSSKSSNRNNKGDKKKTTSTKETTDEKFEWKDREVFLKGIPTDIRKARAEKDQCARCGKPGHKWFKCRGEIVISSTRKKRKAEQEATKDEEGDKSSSSTKKAKVSAMSSAARQLASRISLPNESRIYEMDSEAED